MTKEQDVAKITPRPTQALEPKMGIDLRRSELWQRIRAARRRAGLRQTDIADAFNIDRTAVTQWESKSPDRRTRPDIERLREFGEMTRTPLWWLMSDEVNLDEPWPEEADMSPAKRARPDISYAEYVREIWVMAVHSVREKRSDLWDRATFDPDVPDWMRPFAPDAMSERTVVTYLGGQRPTYTAVANAASALLTWQVLQRRAFQRRAVMVWVPDSSSPELLQSKEYARSVAHIRSHAFNLEAALGVHVIEVSNASQIADHLLQLL